MFQASVIIPVYNAERYIKKAVESAVELDEVGEVILVEDKSPDNALEICKQLALQYSKVKLYQHPNGENRGAGASRNLGIKMAKFDYIAFLDADDMYLPNRFSKCKNILVNDDVDGVYEPVGSHYYSPEARLMYMRLEGLREVELADHVYNLKQPLCGQKVFESFFENGVGRFCTDGIVVKKELFQRAGVFNETLRLHQDSELWIRLAYHGNLVPGEREAVVALRGVHSENRITRHKNTSTVHNYRKAIFDYFIVGKKKLPLRLKMKIIKAYISSSPEVLKHKKGSVLKIVVSVAKLFLILIKWFR